MNRGFFRLSISTLVAVVLVILAGSVVRTTGSGMGCPDWPKCFGQWIPPTDISQIPENYKEIYGKKREEKLLKFCNLLEKIGFNTVAEKMRNDPKLRIEQDFNAGKTWTEAINRYVGFISGNLMLLQLIVAVFLFRSRPSIVLLSFINLVLILFTAWLGAIVVATNLLPWIITIHMALAIVIVVIQVRIIDSVSNTPKRVNKQLKNFILFFIGLCIVQIILGTQVRQQIDVLAENISHDRSNWIANLNYLFLIHRSFSILILLTSIYLFFKVRKEISGFSLVQFILVLVGLEILTGIILGYLSVPAVAQPMHLILSSLLMLFSFKYYFSFSRK